MYNSEKQVTLAFENVELKTINNIYITDPSVVTSV